MGPTKARPTGGKAKPDACHQGAAAKRNYKKTCARVPWRTCILIALICLVMTFDVAAAAAASGAGAGGHTAGGTAAAAMLAALTLGRASTLAQTPADENSLREILRFLGNAYPQMQGPINNVLRGQSRDAVTEGAGDTVAPPPPPPPTQPPVATTAATAGPSSSTPAYSPEQAKADAQAQLDGVQNLLDYRNFVNAFGDTDDESFPRLQKIINSFRAFLRTNVNANPPQPLAIAGMERQGKTPAIEYCTKMALQMGMAVLIGVAPTKVAPVKDMRRKLGQSGFDAHGITTTLADRYLDDDSIRNSPVAHVMIFAITSPTDYDKAAAFVQAHAQQGRRTIVILDECDELVMGKGRSTVEQNASLYATPDRRHDQGAEPHEGDSDSDSSATQPDDDDDDDGRDVMQRVYDVAESEKRFKERLQPKCFIILVTATFAACWLKTVGFFKEHEILQTLRIRESPGYAGVLDMEIPEGCEASGKSCFDIEASAPPPTTTTPTTLSAETPPMSTPSASQPTPAIKMMQNWLERKNPSDGVEIEHRHKTKRITVMQGGRQQVRSVPETLTVHGSLFLSISSRVAASGGAFEIAQKAMNFVEQHYPDRHDRVLFICFVGDPWAYIGGNTYRLNKGDSLEDMVSSMRANPDVDGFDRICFIGWNLTRRAMTASIQDRGHLYTPMYAIVHFPQQGKLDAESQRLLRAGHDFGAYVKPANYKIWVCARKRRLERLKKYRRFENEAIADNEVSPKAFAQFKSLMKVRENGLEYDSVSKRNRPLGILGRDEPEAKRCRRISTRIEEEIVKPFEAWLHTNKELAESTASEYARHVKRVLIKMTADKPLEDGKMMLEEAINELVAMDEYKSLLDELDVGGKGHTNNTKKALKNFKEFKLSGK